MQIQAGQTSDSMNIRSNKLAEAFDFSDAYVISAGCGGTAKDYGVMGDVFIITSITKNIWLLTSSWWRLIFLRQSGQNNFAAGSVIIQAILAGSL